MPMIWNDPASDPDRDSVLSPSPSSVTWMSASLTGPVVFVFSGSDVTAPVSETAVGARFAAVEGA